MVGANNRRIATIAKNRTPGLLPDLLAKKLLVILINVSPHSEPGFASEDINHFRTRVIGEFLFFNHDNRNKHIEAGCQFDFDRLPLGKRWCQIVGKRNGIKIAAETVLCSICNYPIKRILIV